VSISGAISTRRFLAFCGVGDRQAHRAAVRTIHMISIGGAILSTGAIPWGATVALDVSTLAGQDVLVSSLWLARCGIDMVPDAWSWHFELIDHSTFILHLPDDAQLLWVVNTDKVPNAVCVVPMDQET
jgi:hypothetical protein